MSAPTCGDRLLFGLRRTVVSKERISRFLSEKKSVQRGGADFGSAAGAGKMSAARPSLNALGPRATSGARPTAGKQPEFTSGVKRSRRRASGAGRTACLAQTGLRVLWETAERESPFSKGFPSSPAVSLSSTLRQRGVFFPRGACLSFFYGGRAGWIYRRGGYRF